VVRYRHLRAVHPDRIYYYLTFERIHGFMGHWMNFGGQQMLVFAALVAFLLLAPRVKKFWWIVLAIVALSIVLNFTRGVWLGCFVAAIYSDRIRAPAAALVAAGFAAGGVSWPRRPCFSNV